MKKLLINLAILTFSLLLFSACNSTDIGTSQNGAESQVTEWAVKLNAIDSEGKLGNTNTRFGQTYPAVDEADRYDLQYAPRPFGGDYMEVVYTMDGDATEYSTDYHSVKKDQYDSWNFIVKTNDPDRTVTLSWQGIFKIDSATDEYDRVRLFNEFLSYDPIMEHMQLVDMKTGEVISAVLNGKVQSYTFNMDGETERAFKWEYLSEKVLTQPQNASSKESAIELGKQFSRKYQQKIEPDTFPSEFN